MNSDFGQIMQLGYVVEDIETTAREWVERTGAGPFYTLDQLEMDQYYYRGERTDLTMSLAFGYWGDIQVELIHPLNEADTLYTRALKDAPGKLNHLATVVSDLDALLSRHQLNDRVIQSGKMPTGLQFVYLEEHVPGGLHLELIEAQDSTLQAFEGMKQIAAQWDGSHPLRPMSAVGDDLAALKR